MKIIVIILIFTLVSCASTKGSKCPAYGLVKTQNSSLS